MKALPKTLTVKTRKYGRGIHVHRCTIAGLYLAPSSKRSLSNRLQHHRCRQAGSSSPKESPWMVLPEHASTPGEAGAVLRAGVPSLWVHEAHARPHAR
eukprot:scaffold1620_cov420-Prasinococcus_capsulatus_cf.AAC.5